MTTSPKECPFCRTDPARVFHVGKLVRGIWDAFPVNPGHALIVPKRHIASWFDATPEECGALLSAADLARELIEKKQRPDGYNIGINVGQAAGQTIDHLHVHVIPRYAGDVKDPRGGVRHVIPARGNYLEPQAVGAADTATTNTHDEKASIAARGAGETVAAAACVPGGPAIAGKSYSRAEIPLAFGLAPDVAFRSQALFRAGSHVFLIVTLGEGSQSDPGGRGTHFVAPDVLEWHGRGGSYDDVIAGAANSSVTAAVFVRATSKTSKKGTMPYTYCGEAVPAERISDRPLVVRWRLAAKAPPPLL